MKKIGINNKRNMKIGLLGGSFNPAHKGHLYISKIALRQLNLNEIWWIITPQNPLKSSTTYITYNKRIKLAENLIKGNKIRINPVENNQNNYYTANTLNIIAKKYSAAKFIWLMGADNLTQLNKWYRWKYIFNIMPIAVFDRENYSYSTFNSISGKRYFSKLYRTKSSESIFKKKLPSWTFLHIKKNPLSSSKIRKYSF